MYVRVRMHFISIVYLLLFSLIRLEDIPRFKIDKKCWEIPRSSEILRFCRFLLKIDNQSAHVSNHFKIKKFKNTHKKKVSFILKYFSGL